MEDAAFTCAHPKVRVEEKGTVLRVDASKTTGTALVGPAFDPGCPCSVRFVVVSKGGSNVHVGAAPMECKQTEPLRQVGLGFAADGAVRYFESKVASSSSSRQFDSNSVLELYYDPIGPSVELWHLRGEITDMGLPEGLQLIQTMDLQNSGSPIKNWRFAVGWYNTTCTFKLLPDPVLCNTSIRSKFGRISKQPSCDTLFLQAINSKDKGKALIGEPFGSSPSGIRIKVARLGYFEGSKQHVALGVGRPSAVSFSKSLTEGGVYARTEDGVSYVGGQKQSKPLGVGTPARNFQQGDTLELYYDPAEKTFELWKDCGKGYVMLSVARLGIIWPNLDAMAPLCFALGWNHATFQFELSPSQLLPLRRQSGGVKDYSREGFEGATGFRCSKPTVRLGADQKTIQTDNGSGTALCGPAFDFAPGCLRIKVKSKSGSYVYVGLADLGCNQGQCTLGFSFAADGTIRVRGEKSDTSSKKRAFKAGDELELYYNPITRKMTLYADRSGVLMELCTAFCGTSSASCFAVGWAQDSAEFEILPSVIPTKLAELGIGSNAGEQEQVEEGDAEQEGEAAGEASGTSAKKEAAARAAKDAAEKVAAGKEEVSMASAGADALSALLEQLDLSEFAEPLAKQGLKTVKDVENLTEEEVDELASSTGMGLIHKKKLKGVLKQAPAKPRRRSTEPFAGETREVDGRKYKVLKQLADGNSKVWRVSDERGIEQAMRVLKSCEVEGVQAEVAAREALGWKIHSRFVLEVVEWDKGGTQIVLESAKRTLRQRLNQGGRIDPAQAIPIIKHLLEGLKELDRVGIVHLDVKPENLFMVLDERTDEQIWKLGDFDSHRKQNEAVGAFTAHYTAPEVAAAELQGKLKELRSDPKMDIFSAGLVVFEMAAGTGRGGFLSLDMDKADALEMLGGDGLEAALQEQVKALPAQQRALLQDMVKLSPKERKSAEALLLSHLSGQIGTTIRGEANREVLAGQAALEKKVLSAIEQAEERLAQQVREGNELVIKLMRETQQQLLPNLLSAVKQQALELRCCEGLEAADLAGVQAHIETLCKQAVQQTPGNDESLKQMISDVANQGPSPGEEATIMISKLDLLVARMEEMQMQFSEMSSKVDKIDERTEKQALEMGKLSNMLDQLLQGEHEQVFRFFVLIPKPTKGRMGKFLRDLEPQFWFKKAMLLVPYYQDKDGSLKPAPGLKPGFVGFEVARPKDFVKAHPRAVQLAMLAFKCAAKVAASQICINLPTDSLEALNPLSDSLFSDAFDMACNVFTPEEEEEDAEEVLEKAKKGDVPPEETLNLLMKDNGYKDASKLEYKDLKKWMDEKHPGWETQCGLVQVKDDQTGRYEWLPPNRNARA